MDAAVFNGILGGGLAAFLIQQLLNRIYSPNVKIDARPHPSALVDTPFHAQDGVFTAKFLRVRVVNKGLSPAIGCRVHVTHITKLARDGSRAVLVDDDPFDLSWAYGKVADGTSFVRDVPRGMTRFADVCFAVSGGKMAGLHLASDNFPMRLEPAFNTPGTFEVTVVVSGNNFSPAKSVVSFSFESSWNSLAFSA